MYRTLVEGYKKNPLQHETTEDASLIGSHDWLLAYHSVWWVRVYQCASAFANAHAHTTNLDSLSSPENIYKTHLYLTDISGRLFQENLLQENQRFLS